MKRILLGTTALVAAAGFATGASAQTSEPIKMRISGYYGAAIGDIVNKSGSAGFGHRQEAFKQDTEVHFLGETKLDNGLIVGVHFELEGQSGQAASVGGTPGVGGTTGAPTVVSGDFMDETWMYFKGNWGELRFGDEDDIRKLKAYVAPVADPGNTFGVNSPLLAFTNSPLGTNTTTTNIENDQTKIIYFTPTIFGFSLGASYAPDGQSHAGRACEGGNANSQFGASGGSVPCPNGSNPLTTNGATATGGFANSNSWSVAGNYDGKFGDFTIGVGAGYTQANPERFQAGQVTGEGTAFTSSALDTVHAWRAGGVVGFGPFKFGGSIEQVQGMVGNANALFSCNSGTAPACSHTIYDLGGTYTIGPFSVGLAASTGNFHHPYGISQIQQAQNTNYALTAHYVIGPGISLEGAVSHFDYSSGGQFSNITVFNGAAGTAGVVGQNAPFGVERNYHDTALMLGTRINF
jgi:outer membrane protein OmpU